MDARIVVETKKAIEKNGTDGLIVNDLMSNDLPCITWSGSPLHIKSIERALGRVAKGEVEYLAVRSPSGWPVAIGGIDYARNADAGTLWQLATYATLQSLGLGRKLIQEAETHIRRRGLKWAKLDVEEDNHRAQSLYRKLGYETYGHGYESWDELDNSGATHTHKATVVRMKKRL